MRRVSVPGGSNIGDVYCVIGFLFFICIDYIPLIVLIINIDFWFKNINKYCNNYNEVVVFDDFHLYLYSTKKLVICFIGSTMGLHRASE